MKKSLAVLLAVLTVLLIMCTAAAAENKVPASAQYYKGHAYALYNTSKDWAAAEKYCEKLGGHLVTITSSGEQGFIEKLLRSSATKNKFWIGGKRVDGGFAWVTGEKWKYTHWHSGEPNNWNGRFEDRIMIHAATSGSYSSYFGDWNDLYHDGTCPGLSYYTKASMGFICEWESTDLNDAEITLSNTECVYDGKAQKPTVTVKLFGKKLKKDTNYTVTYTNNTQIGTATVTVKGKGAYTGSAKATFSIIPGTPSLTVSSKEDSAALVKVKQVKGAAGYEYSYRKAGDKKFTPIESFLLQYTIKGLEREKTYEFRARAFAVAANKKIYGDYSDVKKVTIYSGKDISGGTITIGKSGDTYTYTGKAIFPGITVKLGLKTLTNMVDYELTWKKNTNVGTATVTATGVGKYRGELKGTFVIVPAKITDKMISVSVKDPLYYTGSAIKPKVTAVYKGMTLKKGTDYSVKYMNNIDAGIACVTVTGKGNFSESATVFFNIMPLPLSECEVTLPDGDVYPYTGEEVRPNVLVKHGDTEIPAGSRSYKVTYKNNIEGGKAKAVVTGKGNLSGSVTLDFEIVMLRVTVGNHQDYMTRFVNKKIQESDYKEGLENGKVVIFMFEGCGSDSSTAKRSNATCVVVKMGEEGLEVACELPDCSTLPDNPLKAKLNWTGEKSNYGPVPTVKDGEYGFTYINHNGEYAALNVTNAKVVRFDDDESNWKKWNYNGKDSWLEGVRDYRSTSASINVHHRYGKVTATSRNSTGCLTISQQTSGFTKDCDYWDFLVASGRITKSTSGIKLAPGSAPGKGGWIIVDRTQARNYLRSIYGNETAVKRILGED